MAKLKNLKNFDKCKKNSLKFKIFKEPSFLNSITKLAYTQLMQAFWVILAKICYNADNIKLLAIFKVFKNDIIKDFQNC